MRLTQRPNAGSRSVSQRGLKSSVRDATRTLQTFNYMRRPTYFINAFLARLYPFFRNVIAIAQTSVGQ